MDLAPLVINPDEAEEALKHYERQLAEERTVEDEAIRAGYRAAARGLPVISLTATFAAAGTLPQENGLPRLAIARANAANCWVRRLPSWAGHHQEGWLFSDQARFDNRGALVGKHTVAVHGTPTPGWNQGKTIVPIIPPNIRPRRQRLHNFHILWEVDAWVPEPPVDPALLRHVRGDLWSVVATWDLTDLERAVLSQRGVNR